jgi:hypothetical protein
MHYFFTIKILAAKYDYNLVKNGVRSNIEPCMIAT